MDAATPSTQQATGRLVVAAAFGFPIGVLSGFTGVGGGEYRAPVLLALLANVRWSIAANLFVGVTVSTFNAVLRSAWSLPAADLLIASLLIATSLPGAYVGAMVTKLASGRALKALLAGILVATALRLLLVETRGGGAQVVDGSTILLALGIGFALGLMSGLLGLAAGEYRIPALILLFGVPTVAAGTVSSLCAVPQQLVGFLKHRQLRNTGAVTLRLGAVMGAASVLGVAIGVFLLGRTTDAFVTQVLGIAMLAAASRIVWDIRRPHTDED